ncbi:MAG: hypothetical protein ACRC4M_03250 [Mycoplasma sp.]
MEQEKLIKITFSEDNVIFENVEIIRVRLDYDDESSIIFKPKGLKEKIEWFAVSDRSVITFEKDKISFEISEWEEDGGVVYLLKEIFEKDEDKYIDWENTNKKKVKIMEHVGYLPKTSELKELDKKGNFEIEKWKEIFIEKLQGVDLQKISKEESNKIANTLKRHMNNYLNFVSKEIYLKANLIKRSINNDEEISKINDEFQKLQNEFLKLKRENIEEPTILKVIEETIKTWDEYLKTMNKKRS